MGALRVETTLPIVRLDKLLAIIPKSKYHFL